MQNVSYLNNFRDVNRATQDSPLFFPVAIRPLEVTAPDGTRIVDDRHQVVLREDTNTVLSPHGALYKVHDNADLFGACDDAVRNAGLDLGGLTIRDEVSHGGARGFRTYTFPQHAEAVQVDDIIQLRLRVANSYDGSIRTYIGIDGNRLVCTNGMTAMTELNFMRFKHTAKLDPLRIAAQLQAHIEGFYNDIATWRRWNSEAVTEDDAEKVMAALAGKSEKLFKELQGHWKDEKRTLGNTKWALFNAMTYWSTHADVRDSAAGNRPGIVHDREARVRTTARKFLLAA